jgi:ligand-binding sensor domain-containing protein/signal transduction histidine kinase
MVIGPRPGHATTAGVPQATINPIVVRLPIVDGNDIKFTRISPTAGLSQTQVLKIAQDNQGFIWFGTQYGLNRYDGYRFREFKHDPKDPGTLSGVHIYALFKDRAGALWVGCFDTLDRLDPTTERVTHYRIDPARPGGPSQSVTHISQDKEGMLWLATSNGLYMLDPTSGKTARFAHLSGDPFSLSSNSIKSTSEDRSGLFWVATSEGVDSLDRRTGKITLHIPLKESHEMFFYEDSRGRSWITYASGNGLAEYARDTRTVTRYSFATRELAGAPLTGVIAMLEDHAGKLWLGTGTDGILQLDVNNKRFVRYKNHPDDPRSLTDNRVITLFEDREGDIWLGLGASEPSFFTTKSVPFLQLPYQPGNDVNLGEALVNAICEDRRGNLWMGTTGALNKYDRTTGLHVSYQVPGHGINGDVISIIEDKDGMLWLGTNGQGLFRFDPLTRRMKAYRHDPDNPASLSGNAVYRLFIDRDGTLWATTSDGLDHYDAARDRFDTYRYGTGTIAVYFAINEDRRGTLWIGSPDGLLGFDPKTRAFRAINPKNTSGERINSIYVDNLADLWLGTQSGLKHVNPNTGIVASYFEADGLPSNAISCILGGDDGALWLSTTRGISRFDTRARTIKNYSIADGLPGADLTGYSACYKSASGEMFFGGFAGATAFYPKRVIDDNYVPAIVLTELDIAGVPVSPAAGTPLTRTIGYTQQLTLTNNQNTFALEFAALSFRNPATNRYRYTLAGLDSDWHQVTSERRLASYTALGAGAYEFRLQGATSRGPWSEPGTALRITILPPWWGTWWFRSIIGLLIAFFLWSAYRYRMRQIAGEFQIRLQERISERARIARELHDSMLQGFQGLVLRLQAARNMLPGKPLEAAGALDAALDRADRTVAEGRAAVEELRTATLISTDPVETLRELGQELLESSHAAQRPTFRVLVEGQPRPLDITVGDDIYFIAREAMRNAITHGRATELEAELSFSNQSFSMRIRDSGVGIDPLVLREGRRRGHWGLPGMRERANSVGAEMRIWSEQGAGTEIEITVPGPIAYGTRSNRERSNAQEESE